MLSNLINNGYSTRDIIDLCELYLTQITNFESKYTEYNHSELIEEVHRLKGGAALLNLDVSLNLLKSVEDSLKSEPLEANALGAFEKLLSEVKSDVNTLIKYAINTT